MPHFIAIGRDLPGAEPARMAARPAHFAYIETIMDRIAVAGPLKDEAGRFVGSILIYETENLAAARALLEADPYFKAGIWDAPEVHAFTPAVGTWIGGKIW